MHAMKTIYHFSDDSDFGIEAVGGKGFSLVRMSQAGLPVPPGFPLTVRFFQPWVTTITGTSEWKELLAADETEWPQPGIADWMRSGWNRYS